MLVKIFSLIGVLIASVILLSYAGGYHWYASDLQQRLPVRNYFQSVLAASPPAVETVALAQTTECKVDQVYAATYGRTNLDLSRVHDGSRFRLAKVLDKARRGDKIKVALLGGSVSTGHGFADGKPFKYGAIKRIWWHTVRDGLEQLLGGADSIEFVDGAKPAVGSGYFAWCYSATSHIGTDADLVLLESAVNDVYSPESQSDAEDLLRAMLQLPSEPAVIYVDSFALRSEQGGTGMLNGADAHTPLASFYDVSEISIRGPVLPAMLLNRTLNEPYFKTDPRHIAQPLHTYLGDLVVAFLQDTMCKKDEILAAAAEQQNQWSTETSKWLGSVPRLKISDPLNSHKSYPNSIPLCKLAHEDLNPSAPSPGWTSWSWKDTKHYLTSTKPDSTITFRIKVKEGGLGVVALSYLRSKKYDLGRVTCWVRDGGGGQVDESESESGVEDSDDGDVVAGTRSAILGEATFDGFWDRGVSIPQEGVIATNLTPGREYEVQCRTPRRGFKGKEFRILGLLSK